MPFWIFLSTHSGFIYEIAILNLSLIIYFRRDLFARRSQKHHWGQIAKQIFIIAAAFTAFRLIGEFIKIGTALPRPCWGPVRPSPISCPDSFSFPSGHALGAFMLVVFIHLIYQIKPITWAGLILAALVSISRLAVNVHGLADIIAGGAMGAIFGLLLWKFYWKETKLKL